MDPQYNLSNIATIKPWLSNVITVPLRAIIGVVLCCTIFAGAANANANSVPSDDALNTMFEAQDYKGIVDTLEPISSKTIKQYNLLISAMMNTDLDDAEMEAERFIEEYKDDYRAYHMHASVMGAQATSSIFSALGYAKKAKESLQKAVTIAPDEIEVYQALMQFYVMAPSIAGGDLEEAKKLADKITQMDALEGKFATATIYAADDKKAEAKAMLTALAEQPKLEIRARFELGRLYIDDEKYDDAVEALSPLLSLELSKADKSDEQAWNAYSESKFSQLYGVYRIGWVAVKASQHTELGINALTQYLAELDATDVNTQQLPSKDWANLRLAELFLNADDVAMATTTVAKISKDGDKRLAKMLKTLKKQIKKRT